MVAKHDPLLAFEFGQKFNIKPRPDGFLVEEVARAFGVVSSVVLHRFEFRQSMLSKDRRAITSEGLAYFIGCASSATFAIAGDVRTWCQSVSNRVFLDANGKSRSPLAANGNQATAAATAATTATAAATTPRPATISGQHGRWLSDAVAALRTTDGPLFGDRPIFVLVDDGTLAPKFSCGDDCFGFTRSDLDVDLYEAGLIDLQGRRGFACVLAEKVFTSPGNVASSLLHEAAHHADAQCSHHGRHAATASDLRAARQAAREYASVNRAKQPRFAPGRSPDYDGACHGSRFARAACHMAHRASIRQKQCTIDPGIVLNHGPFPGRSDAATYLAALRDELWSKAAEPLTQVLLSDPPAKFVALATRELGESGSTFDLALL